MPTRILSRQDEANIKRTVTATLRNLKEQEIYQNLSNDGKELIKNRDLLEMYVRRSYANEPIAQNRARDLTAAFTKTGRLAWLKAKGGIGYGRETERLFKEAKMRNITEIVGTQTQGRDSKGRTITKEVVYKVDLKNIREFMSSASLGSIIALRINLDPDSREDILAEYGY